MKYLEWEGTKSKPSVIGLGCMRMADLSFEEADRVVKAA